MNSMLPNHFQINNLYTIISIVVNCVKHIVCKVTLNDETWVMEREHYMHQLIKQWKYISTSRVVFERGMKK